MTSIPLLRPGDPPDRFPPPEQALNDPDGLLAAGGDLSPERLLAAYRRGIFPWFEEGQPILWWSPDPRAVLLPGDLRVSRSLRRRLRSNRYTVSVDQCFGDVIGRCADTRRDDGTWITGDMQKAYLHLHDLGFAHSVETWQQDELVGGLYGIALGGIFFGESMFSTEADASKVALVGLTALLERRQIALIDCQVASPHLLSMGSTLMPRREFLQRLRELLGSTAAAGNWAEPPQDTAALVGPTAVSPS